MALQEGVSIIVPIGQPKNGLSPSLLATCEAVAALASQYKELILSLEAGVSDGFLRDPGFVHFPFVRALPHKGPKGMRMTRMHAIREAKYDLLLFVDDDSFVSVNWVKDMAALTREYGIVGGPIVPIAKNSTYAKLEGLIDQYRIQARTSSGEAKFVSFSNFGIRRELLPKIPFDEVAKLYGNDMDLGCRLRVLKRPIHIAADLAVKTQYPGNLSQALSRKLRHAKGIAYTERRMGPERWLALEFGDHATIFWRWVKISLKAPVSLREKFIFLIMNMTYVLGLSYYFNLNFRKVPSVTPEDLE